MALLLSLFALAAVACDEPAAMMAGEDASARDAGVDLDAFVADDGSAADAGQDAALVMPDAARPCGAGSCAEGEVCLREVCVADCGEDLSGLDAALAADLVPIQNFCVTPAGPLGAYAPASGAPLIYEVVAQTEGRETVFTLARWSADVAEPAPTIVTVGEATYSAPADGVMVFLGGYLSVSPDGTALLFGYTTTKSGFVGGVFDMLTGDGSVSELPGPGNFDAAWIDAGAYVVNGQGLDGIAGGQGLYVRDRSGAGATEHAASSLGAYSGGVALLDESTVLAGGSTGFGSTWNDGTEGGRLFAIPLADLLAATSAEPLDVESTATIPWAAGPSAFTWLPGRGVASPRYAADFSVEAIEVRSVSVAGGAMTLGAPEDLGTAAITGVTPVGTRLLLHHESGLLLVE